MAPLRLFSVFHLNILFSSIPETARPEVVERCYWPLLRIAEHTGARIGIEATGYTLEEIDRIDPAWTQALREQVAAGRIEFLGSGYAQVIGPLVPAEVTAHNLAIGNETYERLLGIRPTTGYIDEQTYSAGLIALYAETGYEGLVMEWNNAARYQKDWDSEWRYRVVEAVGTGDTSLPMLWNNSIAFQKFQRYAHAETELPEYLSYLASQQGGADRVFSLYGNDAEIFDFRPGRYKTEAVLDELHEWDRIEVLYQTLDADAHFVQALPCTLIAEARAAGSMPRVHLETPEQPIVVKKQQKYNLSRWALTGRDSISINTECFRIYDALVTQGIDADPALWKDLCYAWDSDFRTHITEERFLAYRTFLKNLARRAGATAPDIDCAVPEGATQRPIVIEGNRFRIETTHVQAVFNVRRGLVFDSLIFSDVSDASLVGTIPHGKFDSVPFNADFYAGNTVVDVPAMHRSTDLEPARDVAAYDLSDGSVLITGTVPLADGTVRKHIHIEGDRVHLTYVFDVQQSSPARFHTGLLTFNPDVFNRETLYYACTNGGREQERFSLSSVHSIEPEVPVSMFVSTGTVLGNTVGRLVIGDKDKSLVITTDPAQLAALPFVGFTDLGHTYFLRSAFSLAEFDDTTRLRQQAVLPLEPFTMTLTAERTVH